MSGQFLDRSRVKELLLELGARLAKDGVEARIFVVGGAAMALLYNRSRLTRDIDAIFEPKMLIYEHAQQMADEYPGLPKDWLNDGVKGFMPDLVLETPAVEVFSGPGISVGVASPEYMFAMKASAARSEVDRQDLRYLLARLDIGSVAAAFDLVERYYSRSRLTPKSQFVIEEIVAEYLRQKAGEDPDDI